VFKLNEGANGVSIAIYAQKHRVQASIYLHRLMGPISAGGESYASPREVVEAATQELLRRFPRRGRASPSVHDELRELKAQIEQRFSQPTLF
jgi:hypothetical protein